MRSTFAFAALAAMAMLVTALTPAIASGKSQQAAGSYTAGRYIVTFADDPVADYDGYEEGFPATRPGRRQASSNAELAAVEEVAAAPHRRARRSAGQGRRHQDLRLHRHQQRRRAPTSPRAQADRSSPSTPGVVAPRAGPARPARHHADSPDFLGLDAAGGLWSQLGGGPRAGAGRRRRRASTAASGPRARRSPAAPASRSPAELARRLRRRSSNFAASTCNDKLDRRPLLRRGLRQARTSPRTTSCHRVTAPATGRTPPPPPPATTATDDDHRRQPRSASARAWRPAPRSRRTRSAGRASPASPPAASTPTASPRSTTRSLDGVDVINYSIGGTLRVDVARPGGAGLPGASNAGVFVANSAGNSGPGAEHARPPGAVGDHGRRRDVPPRLPGRRARQRRRATSGASTTPPLPTLDAARHGGERQARRRGRRPTPRCCFAGHARPGEGRRQDRASATAA